MANRHTLTRHIATNASEFLVCIPVFKKQNKESQDSLHQTAYTCTGSFLPSISD